MKSIKVTLQEERTEDAWFDLSLRELRAGEVRFYKASDLQTGQWLFKICCDQENGRSIVKAIKCPPGRLFSQLEGATMLFQKSLEPGMYYDIISLTKVDGDGKVHRELVKTQEDIPAAIRDNFQVKNYDEATGKKLPGTHLVTLSKEDNEKDMITLFILERARTLPREAHQKSMNLMTLIKEMQKTSLTEVGSIASETYNIPHEELDKLVSDLEAKGKIKRLDENFVKLA
ncbi:MAG: hypothetical protein NWF00_04300 [Candidatus Bathyarchaeota archaeon]|nr:hypothetical protein [Candidatus Bathyarchaeota archaeon]